MPLPTLDDVSIRQISDVDALLVKDEATDKKPALLSLANQALAGKLYAEFLIIFQRLNHEDIITEAATLVPLIRQYVRITDSKPLAIFPLISQQNNPADIYIELVKEELPEPVCEHLFKELINPAKHIEVLKQCYINLPIYLVQHIPVLYFSLEDVSKLLDTLQVQYLSDKAVYNKMAHLYHRFLLSYHNAATSQTRCVELFKHPAHGRGFTDHFLHNFAKYPKSPVLFSLALEHANLGLATGKRLKGINTCLFTCLKELTKPKERVAILKAYENCFTQPKLFKLIADSLDADPSQFSLFESYIFQLEGAELVSFVALNPRIEGKTQQQLLTKISGEHHIELLTLVYSTPSSDNKLLRQIIYSFIANHFKTKRDSELTSHDEKTLSDFLFDAAQIFNTADLLELCHALYQQFQGSSRQEELLLTLISIAGEAEHGRHNPGLNAYIKTSISDCLKPLPQASGLMSYVPGRLKATNAPDAERLLSTYHQTLGSNNFIGLITHLVTLKSSAIATASLLVAKSAQELVVPVIKGDILPGNHSIKCLEALDDDNLGHLIITLADDEAIAFSHLEPALIQLISRLDTSPRIKELAKAIFSNEVVVTCIMQSVASVVSLSTITSSSILPFSFSGSTAPKPEEQLENRLILFLQTAGTHINNSRHMRVLAENLLLAYHNKVEELITLLQQTTQHLPKQFNFTSKLNQAIYELLHETPATDVVDEAELYQQLKTQSITNQIQPKVYASIAKTLASGHNYQKAATQLENIGDSIAHLQFGGWTPSLIANILANSSLNSPNWQLALQVATAQFSDTDNRLAFIQELVELVLNSEELPSEFKTKAATLIALELLTPDSLQRLSLANCLKVTQALPLSFQRGEQHFWHYLLEVRKLTIPDVDILVEALAEQLNHEDFIADSELEKLLTHQVLLHPSALGKLLRCIKPQSLSYNNVCSFVALKSKSFDKAANKQFLDAATKDSNISGQALEVVQSVLLQTELTQIYTTDDVPNEATIVNQYLQLLSTGDFEARPALILERLTLLQSGAIHLLQSNGRWQESFVKSNDVQQFLALVLEQSHQSEDLLKQAASFITSVPYTLLLELKNIYHSHEGFYQLIHTVLCTDTNTLEQGGSHDTYLQILHLLPESQQRKIATDCLSNDPIIEFQLSFVQELASTLSPEELLDLYSKHQNKALFAKMILIRAESYHTLAEEIINELLEVCAKAQQMPSIIEALPEDVLPVAVNRMLSTLSSNAPDSWIQAQHFSWEVLLKFSNAITDITHITTLDQEPTHRYSFSRQGQFKEAVKKAVFENGLSFQLHPGSLLYQWVKEWMSDISQISECRHDIKDSITGRLSVDDLTNVLSANEKTLNDALAVSELLAVFPLRQDDEFALTETRWLLYLPYITLSHYRATSYLTQAIHQVQLDSEESIAAPVISALSKLNEALNAQPSSLTETAEDDKAPRIPYAHRLVTIQELSQQVVDACADDDNAYVIEIKRLLSNLMIELRGARLDIRETTQQMKESSLNLELLFRENSRHAKVTRQQARFQISRLDNKLDQGAVWTWARQIHDSAANAADLYQKKLQAFRALTFSSIQAFYKKSSLTEQDRAFLTRVILSGHPIFESEDAQVYIDMACSMLSSAELDKILITYEYRKRHHQPCIEILYTLIENLQENTHQSTVDALITELLRLDKPVLDNLFEASAAGRTPYLASLIDFARQAKAQGEHAPSRLMLPAELCIDSLENLVYDQINLAIKSIQQSTSRFRTIYVSALSYSAKKSKQAKQILTQLSEIDHGILPGSRLANLLNSYARPLQISQDSIEVKDRLAHQLRQLGCDNEAQKIDSTNPQMLYFLLSHLAQGEPKVKSSSIDYDNVQNVLIEPLELFSAASPTTENRITPNQLFYRLLELLQKPPETCVKQTHMFNPIDIDSVEVGLFNLLKTCDFEKQSEILKGLDSNLIDRILIDSISGLSSDDKDRARRSASLLDIITAFSSREDLPNERLKQTLLRHLDATGFSTYSSKLNLCKLGLTEPGLSDTKDLGSTTIKGVWIQRILTNPKAVGLLTAEDIHELIERYRLISKYLKLDEFDTYDKWEAYAKQQLKEFNAEKQKKEFRRHTKAGLRPQEKRSLDKSIAELQKKIETVEKKKERLLAFKANDAVRELLRQLQANIEADKADTFTSTFADFAEQSLNQYFELQLSNYRGDVLSKTYQWFYDKVVGDSGDLTLAIRKESSIFTRLVHKYVRHHNFVTQELVDKSKALVRGEPLYSQHGHPICVLDEGLTLRHLKPSVNLDEQRVSTRNYSEHTTLYNKKGQLVGRVGADGRLVPDSLFMQHTSVAFIAVTPLDELKQLKKLLPHLFKDILMESGLPTLYQQLSTDSLSAPEKFNWVKVQINQALSTNDNVAINMDTASALVNCHDDFITVLEREIDRGARQNALNLIKAWLGTESLAASLVSDKRKAETLFNCLNRLVLTKDELSELTTHLYNHVFTLQVQNLLHCYRYTNETLFLMPTRKPSSYMKENTPAPLLLKFYERIREINLLRLSEKMIKSLHKEVRIALLFNPKYYLTLDLPTLRALISDFSEVELKQLYHYLIKQNTDELLADNMLSLLIENNATLFYESVDELDSSFIKNELLSRLLTHQRTIRSIHQSMEIRSADSYQQVSLRDLFSIPKQLLSQLVTAHAYMEAVHCYVNGFNRSDELRDILFVLTHEKLGDYINTIALSDDDLRAVMLLIDEDTFSLATPKYPQCKSVFNRLVERAAVRGKTSIFYDPHNTLIYEHASRLLHRSLIEDIYDGLTEEQRGSTWDKVKKVVKGASKVFRHLPWVGDKPSNSLSDFAKKSFQDIQGIGGKIKTIDLFLIKFRSSRDNQAQLKKLLNDYCLQCYMGQKATLVPNKMKVEALESTARLLTDESIEPDVQEVIFDVLSSHLRLHSQNIQDILARYNLERLLKEHGKTGNYQEIFALHARANILELGDHGNGSLDRANREAKLEFGIGKMTIFKGIRSWFKRIWTYGFHGFFRINQPTYVCKVEDKPTDDPLVRVKHPANGKRPSSPNHFAVALRQTISEKVQLFLTSSGEMDETDLLKLLDDIQLFRYSTDSSIDDEIRFRSALNQFYNELSLRKQGLSTPESELQQALSAHQQVASNNRQALTELYCYQSTETGINNSAKIEDVVADEKRAKSQFLGNESVAVKLVQQCHLLGVGADKLPELPSSPTVVNTPGVVVTDLEFDPLVFQVT